MLEVDLNVLGWREKHVDPKEIGAWFEYGITNHLAQMFGDAEDVEIQGVRFVESRTR